MRSSREILKSQILQLPSLCRSIRQIAKKRNGSRASVSLHTVRRLLEECYPCRRTAPHSTTSPLASTPDPDTLSKAIPTTP